MWWVFWRLPTQKQKNSLQCNATSAENLNMNDLSAVFSATSVTAPKVAHFKWTCWPRVCLCVLMCHWRWQSSPLWVGRGRVWFWCHQSRGFPRPFDNILHLFGSNVGRESSGSSTGGRETLRSTSASTISRALLRLCLLDIPYRSKLERALWPFLWIVFSSEVARRRNGRARVR